MDYEITKPTTQETPASKRLPVQALLVEKAAGADVDATLKTAVEKNDMELVEALLMSGVADLSMTDPTGNTLLHTAAKLGYPRLCVLLVKHGANVNAQNNAMFTPLFFAARANLQTVCVLLDLGAEVQLCNHLGEIPLHAAASSGLIDVIVTLVSSGSDVNARSWQDLTPVYCAVGSGSRLAVKTLLGLGAEVNGVVTPESRRINTDCVKFCENPVSCGGKEDRRNTDNSNDCQDHYHHVCVRVPRQKQFPDSNRQQAADQILLGSSRVRSESPGIPRSGLQQPRHDCPNSSVGRQHQRGLSGTRGCQQQQHRRPGRACHASDHHLGQVCCPLHCPYGNCHSRHQHRLDARRQHASLFPRSAVHTFENEPLGESLSQDSQIPVSLKSRCCCYDEVTGPRCPVHSSNIVCTCSSRPVCNFHLHYSTCPLQILQRETHTQRTVRTVSRCRTSEEDNHPRLSTYLSVENPLEKVDIVEEVTSQTHIRCSQHLNTDRNAKPENGMTPLHQASQLGMETVAEVLLEAGADVNARTERGETPLHLAAWLSGTSGHGGESTGLLRLLLRAGASVDAVTTGGFSPLHLAALAGDALCTSLLLSAGADLHARDSQGNSPLHKACERIVAPEANRARTVRVLLLKGASARAVNDEGQTPLHVLLMHKVEDDVDHDVVRLLLNHQADPNLPTPLSGEPPLLAALRHRMYGFAKVLVEKGVDLNVSGEDSQTPLHIVCKDGHSQLFKLIWSKGGHPARPDKKGWSPLRYAVERGEGGIVQTCISSGASTFQPMHDDVTAASSCSVEDVFANPARCLSPFQYAFAAAQLPLLVLLYQSGCFSSRELHQLKELCMGSIFQELTDPQQLQVASFVSRVGGTPPSLHNLCCWTISHLIGCGADRKWRARQLGLPALLRDFVLFSKSV